MKNLNKNEIVKLYLDDKLSQQKIATTLNVSQMTICKILKKLKIKARNNIKYTYNNNFFKNINTQEFLYFIGFFIADGFHNEDEGRLHITLNIKDREILDKFNVCIYNGNRPLRKFQSYTKKCDPSIKIDINSRELSDKFVKWNIRQNKSLTCELPNINIKPENFHHFIRGIFDGDGCIYKARIQTKHRQKSAAFVVSIINSKKLCNQLKDRFKILGFNFKLKHHSHCNDNVKSIILSGNRQVERFLNWMYRGSTICLTRKYNKYLDLVNQNKEIDSRAS